MKRLPFSVTLCVTLVLVLLCGTCPAFGHDSDIFIKLFPGREFCVNHEVYRNKEADAPVVKVQHRAMDPRLVHIRTLLYGPGPTPFERGEQIPVSPLDTYGTVMGLYFTAEESGTYTLCLTSPPNHPVLRFELTFTAANDVVQPPTADDESIIMDKPPQLKDYADRLKMLKLSVDSYTGELDVYLMRRFRFDNTVNSILKLTIGAAVLNALLGITFGFGTDWYLKRIVTKQKTA